MTKKTKSAGYADGKIYKYAKSIPVKLQEVKVNEGFWKSKIDQSRTHGLPKLLTQYEERTIVKNFLPERKHSGAANQDEFLYKALEAAAYYMDDEVPEKLKEQYKRIRDIVIEKKRPDGYINTRSISENIEPFSQESHMDFYFAGHLMQAGIAELRITGDTDLFNAAKAYVDLLIEAFTDGGKKFQKYHNYPFTDHPNFEMAVVELYRVTGDRKYLSFCKSILDFGDYENKDAVEAHAVQEMLFNAGGVDYYLETGDESIWQSAVNQWQDMLKKMYVTGGVGAMYRGERFAKPYDLPNSRAYTETCAAISCVFWNWRMFLATGKAKYIDLIERLLYNGVLSGIALNGYEYFYTNPLEYQKYEPKEISSSYCSGRYWVAKRHEFWQCSCCPPNVQRLLASFRQYIYSAKEDKIWVNLFVESTLKHQLPNGANLTINQTTDYPWNGDSEIKVSLDKASNFSLKIRIPGWSKNANVSVTVNDKPIELDQKGGYYLDITREWEDGDILKLSIPMSVRLVRSHPRNTANIGKIVICRGPLVYCLESVDNPQGNIFDIRLPVDSTFTSTYKPELLGGVVLIEGDGFLLDISGWDEEPYQDYKKFGSSNLKPIKIKAVPYYTWANREHGSMITAIPYKLEV